MASELLHTPSERRQPTPNFNEVDGVRIVIDCKSRAIVEEQQRCACRVSAFVLKSGDTIAYSGFDLSRSVDTDLRYSSCAEMP